jgi:hypothetical protein
MRITHPVVSGALALCFGAAALAQQLALSDRAAGLFDDTAVRAIRLSFDNADCYNTLLQARRSDPGGPILLCRFQSGGDIIDWIGCRFKRQLVWPASELTHRRRSR